MRDSGIVHALLGIGNFNELAGHPVVGASWEGFVVENLLAVSPARTAGSFYRTAAGAEIDLVLDMPAHAPETLRLNPGQRQRRGSDFSFGARPSSRGAYR